MKETWKLIFITLLLFVVLIAVYNLGIKDGRKVARQECIDKVGENCEYICGVGADFYFPDKQEQELGHDYPDDSVVAMKGFFSHDEKSNTN